MIKRILRVIFLAAAIAACVAPAIAADLATIAVVSESSSAQSNVPVTFGQVFKQGDVPSGSTVTAKLTGGASVPIQVDAKATNTDGSLRHAVITLKVPSLAANATSSIILSSASSAASGGSNVTLTQLLATTFDAVISLNVGGTTYSASARSLLSAGTPQSWLTGPLVSEWIVGAPVKTSGGSAHPHLAAYFHVRAYSDGSGGVGNVRVDCVVENGWTLVTGPSSFDYTPNITVGGTSVYSSSSITHFDHTRWHKQFWWSATTAPKAYVKGDMAYLRATKAVPNIGVTTVDNTYLNSLAQSATPMSHGDITQNMPDTGAHSDIGPLPRFDAVYIASGADIRALRNALANHDSAGSYSIHYRDEATGRPVSIADHPTVSLEDTGTLPATSGTTNSNVADRAHEPSLGFLAYAVTGDYYYMEEMQFWTSWNQLSMTAGYRMNAQGIVYPHNQNRAQAWVMRNLGQAAYLTPDSHPYKAQLVASIANNTAVYDAAYTNNTSANSLGVVASYDGYALFAPWMDDFITWTMAYLVDLGFNSAIPFRDWKFKFPVNRAGTSNYCFRNAGAYHLLTGTSDTVWYTDFKTFYDANVAAGNITAVTSCNSGDAVVDGYPASGDGYVANFTPALAAAVEAGYPGASAAWARMKASSAQPDFSNYAVWNVVPRVDPGSTSPSVSLSASPTSVSSGGSSTLTWTSTNSTSCTASGGWTGSQTVGSGSQVMTNITSATTYTLTCSGSGGPDASSSAQVTITSASPMPTASLTTSAASVASGGGVTLTWTSTNASACAASGAWTGTKASSGTEAVSNLMQNSTFSLTCSGAGGTSSSQSTTVTVTSSASGGGGTPAPTPESKSGGGSLGFAWLLVLGLLYGARLRVSSRRSAISWQSA